MYYTILNLQNKFIELTNCQKQYFKGENKTAMGCDDDGRFMTTQCNDDYCYCVDADTGEITSAKVLATDGFNLNCSSLYSVLIIYWVFNQPSLFL